MEVFKNKFDYNSGVIAPTVFCKPQKFEQRITIQALVDTGKELSVLTDRVVQDLRLEPYAQEPVYEMRIAGDFVEQKLYVADAFWFYEHSRYRATVFASVVADDFFHGEPYDAVLGHSFLGNGTLKIEPEPGASTGTWQFSIR